MAAVARMVAAGTVGALVPNPFAFIAQIEEMNADLCEKLDTIISKIDELIEVTKNNKVDWYGDGK